MKKILPLLLSLFLLFNGVACYSLLIFHKQLVKKELKRCIKNSIPQNELTVLSFDPGSKEYAALEWIQDHEFKYKGQLFDIVRRTVDKNGWHHFHCLNDKMEEVLFANLDKQAEENSQQNSKDASKKFSQLMGSLFCLKPGLAMDATDSFPALVKPFLNFYAEPSLKSALQPPRLA